MVVKGKSRANPAQLARHLLRTDQNERVEILQCDSSPIGNLREAFKDLQLLAEQGTRGTKGLYHAQINPDARYEMSPEQWARAADILEEELGLSGQPRTVVFHQKKGRPHIHVVWGRTNLKTMTLIADSHNYRAHERASARMEIEFGHDPTPGAHDKRDPEKPRPKAAFNHAAWQQFERTKLDPRQLTAALTDLYKASDSGQAFSAALEEQGYALARGRRGGFILIDPAGNPHKLSRRIEGYRAAEIKAKLADLDPDSLPTVEEAQKRLKARAPEPGQPIPLPGPGPAFNQAASPPKKPLQQPPAPGQEPSSPVSPHDPEAARRQLRAWLEADRQRFHDQLRREALEREAHWAAVRREEMARFDARRETRPKAKPQPATPPLWRRALDALPGGGDRPKQRDAKHRLRDEWQEQQARAQRSRELAAWEQHQRVTFRQQQAEKLAAYEARYAAEIDRLDREAARYAALRRDAEDPTPAREISRAEATPEPPPEPTPLPTTETGPPPHLEAGFAADHQALIARQHRQTEAAERRWEQEAARQLAFFETHLEARRAAERQEEARQARRRFPYLGTGPKPPAPAPKPPRRARWHFRPARAQQRAEQRLREYQAREAWRDRRDSQKRAEKEAALRQQIARQRDALAERHLREQAALEARYAQLRREATRREQLRREREARERAQTRDRGLGRDRDPPLRPSLSRIFRRATTRQPLSSIFRRCARRPSLARLFNRLAQMRRIFLPIRPRTAGHLPSGRPASPSVPPAPPRPLL